MYDTRLASNSTVLESISIGVARSSTDAWCVMAPLLPPGDVRPTWIGVHSENLAEQLATIFVREDTLGQSSPGLEKSRRPMSDYRHICDPHPKHRFLTPLSVRDHPIPSSPRHYADAIKSSYSVALCFHSRNRLPILPSRQNTLAQHRRNRYASC